MTNMDKLVDGYLQWLTDNITEDILENGWHEIATPFVDRFGDSITIYAKQKQNKIVFSDDGMLIADTIGLGAKPTIKQIDSLRRFLAPYSIEVNSSNEMEMFTTVDAYPVRLHLFLQAYMTASDLFAPRVGNSRTSKLFVEEIIKFFDASDIAYAKNVKLEGQSGIIHQVGFILPQRKKRPERLIYALNKATKQNVELTLFNWGDIQRKRGTESNMIAFINDKDGKIPDEFTQAFRAYDALPVPWSQREEYIESLAV